MLIHGEHYDMRQHRTGALLMVPGDSFHLMDLTRLWPADGDIAPEAPEGRGKIAIWTVQPTYLGGASTQHVVKATAYRAALKHVGSPARLSADQWGLRLSGPNGFAGVPLA